MFTLSLHTFVVLLLCFFRSCLTENLPEDWIDPYDMTPSKDYLQFSDSITSMHRRIIENPSCNADNYLAEIYFRRTINMLLNSVHEDFIERDLYSGHLFFKIDAEKFAILKSFADGVAGNDLEAVDKILADIFNKPTHEHLQEYLESWFHKCLNVILSREGIILIIIVSYAFVIYKLFQTNLYSMRVLKFLGINFLLFDFIFTWVNLYQTAQSKDLADKLKYKDLPSECDPGNMNSWEFLANIFNQEDQCEKYFQIKYQDIFYKVTPGMVLTEMFARTVQYPAKSIGQAFGEMSRGIYDAFPWPLNIIIFPVLLFFFCCLTCIVLSLILDKTIKFNLLHIISFSFGGKSSNRTNAQDMISGNNLERLLNITQNQRQLIQEIPVETVTEEKKLDLKQIEKNKAIKNEQKLESNDEKELDEEKLEQNIENVTTDDKTERRAEIGGGDCK